MIFFTLLLSFILLFQIKLLSYDSFFYKNWKNNSNLIRKNKLFKSKLLWIYTSKSSINFTLVYKNILYFIDDEDQLYALVGETGNFLWKKKIPKYLTNANISGYLTAHKNLIILSSSEGYSYAFHRITGDLIWGPVDLKENIYSKPIICKNVLFVATLGKGLIWLIDPDTGKLIFKYPIKIGIPIYTQLLVKYDPLNSRVSFWLSDDKKNIIDFELYIITKFLFIQIQISLENYYYKRLKDIVLKNEKDVIISSPILYTSKNYSIPKMFIFFSTSKSLYSINLLVRKIEWKRPIENYSIPKIIKSYFKPIFWDNLIFYGTKGYSKTNGKNKWYFIFNGQISILPILHKGILFFFGHQNLLNINKGFIAGINPKNKNFKFWIELKEIPSTALINSQGKIYFTTSNGKIYSYQLFI